MKITLDITPEQALAFADALKEANKWFETAVEMAAGCNAAYMQQVYQERAEAAQAVTYAVEKAVKDWNNLQERAYKELEEASWKGGEA